MSTKLTIEPREIQPYLEGVVSGQIRVRDFDRDRDRDKALGVLHNLPSTLPASLVENAFAKFMKSGHATWALVPDLSKPHLEIFLKVVREAVAKGEEEAFDSFYLEAASQGAVLQAHELLAMVDEAEDGEGLAKLFEKRPQVSAVMVKAARCVLSNLAKQDALEEDELFEHLLMILILARDGSVESIKQVECYVSESMELFPDSPADELAHLALSTFHSSAGNLLLQELQLDE